MQSLMGTLPITYNYDVGTAHLIHELEAVRHQDSAAGVEFVTLHYLRPLILSASHFHVEGLRDVVTFLN